MMKIDTALQSFFKFELGANGDKPVLEMFFIRWEDYALMFNILSMIGFSIETKKGLENRFWVEQLPERYIFSLNNESRTGVLRLWHERTYLEITSEGDMKIAGDEGIVNEVANLCLHSNPPLACSVQNGV